MFIRIKEMKENEEIKEKDEFKPKIGRPPKIEVRFISIINLKRIKI